MTTATDTDGRPRWLVKCTRCGRPTVYTAAQADAHWDAEPRDYAFMPCGQCGGRRQVHGISASKGKRACGAWCTEATGTKCTCECEGRNHATAWPPGTLFYLR